MIDFFCGAGGFSEGFRQQGYEIIRGIDFWRPAIETHNLNHGLQDEVKDVLDFWSEDSGDVEEIEKLEDVEVLVGSPSCTSFSMSNRAGKADKSEGMHLIEAFLRVVAVKKHKRGSILLAWYMENVPKSRLYMLPEYTFDQLSLGVWAERNGFKPDDVALTAGGEVLNAADYGAPQSRKRFISGEWVKTSEFVSPKKTHSSHRTVREIRDRMPRVNESKLTRKRFKDPNYPQIQLTLNDLTDHFYDTGVYKLEWEKAEFLKTNHPYMGKMSFPENEDRPCRTIMATRSASTREAILYKSEYDRSGNGEYRLPTIREVSSLMGFPYVYQFCGSEGAKWKQIGNSVSPHQSAALAGVIREKMGFEPIPDEKVDFSAMRTNFDKVSNLNTFGEGSFDAPRRRTKDARFRRHVIKSGNMTVDLMNYHPDRLYPVAQNWYVVVFSGTGEGYDARVLGGREKIKIETILHENFTKFDEYRGRLQNKLIADVDMQKIYERDLSLTQSSNPINLLKDLGKIVSAYGKIYEEKKCEAKFINNNPVPLEQLLLAYGILSITSTERMQ